MLRRSIVILCLAALPKPVATAAEFCIGTEAFQSALTVAAENGEDDIIRLTARARNSAYTYSSSEPYNLEIVGGYDLGCETMTRDSTLTILRSFEAKAGADLTLRNLTITHGASRLDAEGLLTIKSVQFAGLSGVTLSTRANYVRLIDTRFQEGKAVLDYDRNPTFDLSHFVVDRCVFEGSESQLRMRLPYPPTGQSGSATITNSLWNGSLGIDMDPGSRNKVLIASNQFIDGVRTAIYTNYAGEVEVIDNVFAGNRGTTATSHRRGYAGALDVYATTKTVVASNRFIENVGYNWEGGGAVRLRGNATLVNNLFVNNRFLMYEDTAQYPHRVGGGAVLYYDDTEGRLLVANNTFVGNESEGPRGAALAIWSYVNTTPITVASNIFWENTASEGVTDVYVGNGADRSQVPQSFAVRSNLMDTTAAGAAFRFPYDLSVANLSGVAPQFQSVADGNYRLESSSPLIDAGNSDGVDLPGHDLAGNPRVYGNAIDIGAYEFQGEVLSSHHAATEVELGDGIRLQVFPNPVGDQIQVSFSVSVADRVDVGLYDVIGRRLLDVHASFAHPGDHLVDANVSNLPSGHYYVRCVVGSSVVVRPVVVVR